jgi:hypothetical protein
LPGHIEVSLRILAPRRLTRARVTSRILIPTTFDYDEYVCVALRAGASGIPAE